MWLDLPPPQPAVEVSVATRGISKGIAQTEGPQIVARGYLRLGKVQVGGQVKNVTSPAEAGDAMLFVTAGEKLGSLQLTGGVAYKMLTNGPSGVDSTAWEFSGSASRKFGPVNLRAVAIYSPDDLGSTRRSLFVEAGPALQLRHGWALSAAIGRRERRGSPSYTAFNAGIGKKIGALQLDVRYYGNNHGDLGGYYRTRIVGSAKLSF